jgi:hypothetical protein
VERFVVLLFRRIGYKLARRNNAKEREDSGNKRGRLPEPDESVCPSQYQEQQGPSCYALREHHRDGLAASGGVAGTVSEILGVSLRERPPVK